MYVSFILPNVKLTGGGKTDDERLKFNSVEQPKNLTT